MLLLRPFLAAILGKHPTNSYSYIPDSDPVKLSSIISDKVSDITDFNRLCNNNIRRVRNYWLIKPVFASLCAVVRNYWLTKKEWSHKMIIFFDSLHICKHLNIIWYKIPLYNPFKLCNDYQSRCLDVWCICGFSREKSQKNSRHWLQ